MDVRITDSRLHAEPRAAAGDLPEPPDDLPRDREPGLLVTLRDGTAFVSIPSAARLLEEHQVRATCAGLRALATGGQVQILIDASGIEYACSALLAELAWLHRRVFEARGYLRIYGLSPIFRHALHCCALDRVFELYETQAEALAAGDRATALVRFPPAEHGRANRPQPA